MLPGQQAHRERTAVDAREVRLLAERQEFGGVLEDVQAVLYGRTVLARREDGRPLGVVGAPGVRADEPLAYELLAGVAELGGAVRVGVGDVQLVQVDVVGVQAAQ